ncbi:MAG: tRNA (adenosine(37)-N6)-threonylcarbamoyltransferase complex dimerization subunit type 1 TsaB [Planctomycetia bacterium]|nr:tRNA (adenosine(37)-N6)-threonylcarbamoyltransferase complex dimerization subunit type 1 TsaB [Planctomycetia bacterium]
MAETTVKRRHHRVLAIETGSPRGSVAAAHDDHTVARLLGHDGQHGRLVTQALAAVAEEAGFPARAADLVVVVRGPGSFTGLRVGVALAKTLAWSTGAALVGVSGYELIARRVGAGDGPVWVVFEAGRGDVAACRCERRADGWECGPPALWHPDDLLATIPPGNRLAGPGVACLTAALAGRTDLEVDEPAWPTASEGLRLGRERAAAGRHDDAARLLPEYLRPAYVDEPRRP